MFEGVGDATGLEADAELLATAAVPALGVGVIEVAFGILDETNELLDRAVTRAEAHRTGAALLDDDPEVALVGDRRRDRDDPDFLEELGVAQAGLGDADARQVEDLTGAERQLARDDGRTGLGVSLDVQGADREALAFLNLERHGDHARG